jgi:sugar-specific transcriptional regulator TrmB
MNKEILKQVGLTDGEIEVYLCLLRIGPSLVSRISKETGLHRTHIYDTLEKLKEKGLVSTYIQSGKNYFNPAKPNKILQFLDEKREGIQSILPDLEDLTKFPKEETQVELFKGKNGLKTVLQDVLNTKKDYLVMGSIKQFEQIMQFALPQFLKKIEKLNIKEKIICDKQEKILKIKNGIYRYLKSNYLFPSSFWIYGNKVAIFIWNLPHFAIVINNKDVAKTYRNYFEFFWETATI